MKKNTFFLALSFLMLLLASCTQEELTDGLSNQQATPEEELAGEPVETDVTQVQAVAAANKILGLCSAQTRSESEPSTVEEIKTDGETLIYVINYRGGGFALISGKTTYFPVLAYSDKGQFACNSKDTNPGLKQWMEDCKKFVSGEYESSEETRIFAQAQWAMCLDADSEFPENPAVRATSTTSTAQYAFMQRRHELGALGYSSVPLSDASSIASYYGIDLDEFESKADTYKSPRKYTIFAYQQNSYDSGVGSKLTTKWGQGYPYNALSKANSANGAGCVTVAMAQIMKYFQHPTSYNWSNMPDTTATQETQKLIRDIASGLGISYSGSDNDATIIDAQSVFTSSTFQYDATMKNHSFNDVINALCDGNPVFMSGVDSDSSKGHAWVCDGYKRNHSTIKYFVEYLYGSEGNYEYKSPDIPSIDGLGTADRYGSYYLHMNWGWNGMDDGWYLEDNVSNTFYNYNTSRKNLYVSPK